MIDETGMVPRSTIGVILERLEKAAKCDLSKLGIIFGFDPAQLLPIGRAPLWSIKSKKTDNRNYSETSFLAINDIRDAFRMEKLSNIPQFDTFKKKSFG